MEEKILIKAKIYNLKIVYICIFIIGLVLGIFGVATAFEVFPDSDIKYMLTSAIPYYSGIPILICAVVAAFLYWYTSKLSLTVSNKRIYGTAVFGRRVDLPFDMISAVKTIGLFKRISISTSSGSISFDMIKNLNEIHDTISNLLIKRQENKPVNSGITKQAVKSDADELKKYKDLLDSGAITQEEYDSKKKQLLGL